MKAFCSSDAVDSVFQTNLFDDPDLLPTYRALVGLSPHTPFECIGEIDESRLMMKMCVDKGLDGAALRMFKQDVLSDPSINWGIIAKKYDFVHREGHNIPDWLYNKLQPLY